MAIGTVKMCQAVIGVDRRVRAPEDWAMPETDNADQIAYWNAEAGETWAALQEQIDAQLEPHGLRAMEALAPVAGERIVDVGCGSGQTSLALGQAVGRSGAVMGLDISRPLLDLARRRAAEFGAANVSFAEADVQTYAFAPATFEAVFSRFGVMFFADPATAFANVRWTLKSGGRLAFVCWRTPAENVFMTCRTRPPRCSFRLSRRLRPVRLALSPSPTRLACATSCPAPASATSSWLSMIEKSVAGTWNRRWP